MRIALLGADDLTLALAAAAMQVRRDPLVMIDALAARAKEAVALAPKAKLAADWNALLDSNEIDAVLVAADEPQRRIEQLRLIIQVGMPVLVSHPLCLSMLDCYELEMIHSETNSVVLAYLPDRRHPAAIELGEMVDESAASVIGPVEQVLYERFLPKRDRDTVLRQFAQDVDLLQFLSGNATKLHALGPQARATGTSAYANLAVQLTCDEGLVCRWTVAPVEKQPGGRLTLVGSQGKAILWMPDGVNPWRLEIRTATETKSHEFADWNPQAEALEMLSQAREHTEADSNWSEAARAIELAETIDRSLAKGRTIDLHNEEFTDIATFKGTMASIGCGLLLVAILLAGFVAVARAVAFHAGWLRLAAALDWWPYLLLGACGVYLILQLLLVVAKPDERADDVNDISEDRSC